MLFFLLVKHFLVPIKITISQELIYRFLIKILLIQGGYYEECVKLINTHLNQRVSTLFTNKSRG